MNAEPLLKQFQASHYTLHKNLESVTHEESLKLPPGGGSSLNWVLGHLIGTRNLVLDLLGQSPVWDDEVRSVYGGAPPESSRLLPLQQLTSDLDRSQELIVSGFRALSVEGLNQPAFGTTVGDMLTTLAFHEAYHAGQVGLLRRFLGHAGVIKPPQLPPR